MLEVLSAVERDNRITQRSLSRELGIALGLANAYLKRCAKKGLIKIRQVPLNRYAYYLTPKGFAEKSRLTAEYLAVSFNFFRDAREQCSEIFSYCESRGLGVVALAGAGDVAEIAVRSAGNSDIDVVCVIDGALDSRRCAGKPVVADLKAAGEELKAQVEELKQPLEDIKRDVKSANPRDVDWTGPKPVSGPTPEDAMADLEEIERNLDPDEEEE